MPIWCTAQPQRLSRHQRSDGTSHLVLPPIQHPPLTARPPHLALSRRTVSNLLFTAVRPPANAPDPLHLRTNRLSTFGHSEDPAYAPGPCIQVSDQAPDDRISRTGCCGPRQLSEGDAPSTEARGCDLDWTLYPSRMTPAGQQRMNSADNNTGQHHTICRTRGGLFRTLCRYSVLCSRLTVAGNPSPSIAFHPSPCSFVRSYAVPLRNPWHVWQLLAAPTNL